jgi:hypothetical protein
MPSPFPGMDPFLEAQDLFPGLHGRLIAYMAESLQTILPEPYYAEIYERVVVEETGRRIEPDVSVYRDDRFAPSGAATVRHFAATATLPVVVPPGDEMTETYLEILAPSGESERTIAVIEILSPSNKRPGSTTRAQYLRKQREILQSTAHLIEIDLLRGGDHTTAVSLSSARGHAGDFSYHVCVSRSHDRGPFEVYGIHLRDRLPTLSIPLLPQDQDVALDFQAVFDRAYDAGPYRRRLRYDERTLDPPLSPNDATWVAERIAANTK